MKLKSKLIATIVSICAAIAVMGVGVWAATSNFTVSVTNNVNVTFTNLTGHVDVSATAKTTTAASATDFEAAKLIASPNTSIADLSTPNIYQAGTTTKNYAINATGSGDATETTTYAAWEGTNLFTNAYINDTITYAQLEYVFTYTPADGGSGAGFTTVAVTATEPDAANVKGATMTYTYVVAVTGGGTEESAKGTTCYARDNQTITITITALYSNPTKSAVEISADTWTFGIAFTNTLTEPTGNVDLRTA